MNEDFVPYEIAKKLQEKGFNEKCIAHYYCALKLFEYNIRNISFRKKLLATDFMHSYNESTKENRYIDAPTISQILKWLRKEKQLHIVIVTGRNIVTNTHLWGYKIWDLANHVWLHAKIADNSYELAALSGIEFVIDNLLL